MAGSTRSETVVAEPGWVRALWWVGFPLLGAGAGWLLPRLAEWAASLPWAPLRGPFRLVASIPEPAATTGAVLLGVAAGLAVAYQAERESLAVTVCDHRVALAREGTVTDLPRVAVGAAFLDGRQLVLTGQHGEELAREHYDQDRDRLRAAFETHGYPWYPDGDPYRDDFRRWVPGIPELPAAAQALFQARELALRKRDRGDAAQLRAELARLGVVVRDERQRQFWRWHHRPGPGSP